MDAISWNFARTSHVAYANQLGTTSTVASIQGLLGGLTFGLGKRIETKLLRKNCYSNESIKFLLQDLVLGALAEVY
jgi:hypothetical protein